MSVIFQPAGSELASAVSIEEYKRLLGLPRSLEMDDDLLERAEGARRWYAEHGRPFVAAERINIQKVEEPMIRLCNGMEFQSIVLARKLKTNQAHALMIMAVTAGTEVSEKVADHWVQERPDEAFFLDRFAVAVAEHLIFWASLHLCQSSERTGETLLPHLSPGCGNWDITDQHKLMAILTGGGITLGPLELLPSGAVHPQHSYLAASGITTTCNSATPKDLCRSCNWQPCSFRRAPYQGKIP